MRVEFNYSGEPHQQVELRGELPQWEHPIVLNESEPGHYSKVLDLAPGVYACKLRLKQSDWRLLAGFPRDDVTVPHNSTLIVGGAEPPLFFAPCRRCWVQRPGGDLHVFFEVALGANEPSLELLDENKAICTRAEPYWRLQCGSRMLLRAHVRVPIAAQYLRFHGYPGEWPLPEVETTELPAWLQQGLVYSIFVDRWFGAGGTTSDPRVSSREVPSTRTTVYGGDLEGIRRSLGYLKGLGVTAIALTPINPSPSPHRYDALDFNSVDPRLGGEHALDELIRDCHALGIAIVLDLAFSHCNAAHPAFEDLLRHQQNSRYAEWFCIKRFPVSREEPESYRHYPGLPHLPLLNFDSEAVREHLITAALRLVSMGVDGLRLDAIEMIPDPFWSDLRARVRQLTPDVGLLGECLVEPILRYIGQADVVTDFRCRELLLNCFAKGCMNASSLASTLECIAQRHGPDTEQHRLQFLDNHDTNRFPTEAGQFAQLRLALTFILLRCQPVWFYYGTEHALTSHVCRMGQDNAWPDRLPMVPLDTQTKTCELVRQLLLIRKKLADEGFGPALMVDQGEELVCFERQSSRHRIRVLLNVSGYSVPPPDWVKEETRLLTVEHTGSFEQQLPPRTGLVTSRSLSTCR